MPIVFSDSGLHLAVLNALLRREILQESELRKLLAGIESDEKACTVPFLSSLSCSLSNR